ncbi:hypothetical protein HHL16_00385 [Pseudoflavitalea sp. G-6-1-2]|uniref:hypothetical protein n=1 Tax=Pseudoflavitalea sp. G-6-1-2 TaxID=2728841 RepID=UPI00146DD82B|nr:hypothetical protein [Pseudoflavitalea sp. G-6-1-2]NML19302.1 hypothetical protein [Pseudoflavitalea sp. G-6-1-2]
MNAKTINLANVQGRMSRNEMKAIMAGDGQDPIDAPCYAWPCGGGGSGTCKTVLNPDKGGLGCKCSVDTGGSCE